MDLTPEELNACRAFLSWKEIIPAQGNLDRWIQWAEALESGKYNQGRKQLRWLDKFCCLGVLCDISQTSQWSLNKYHDTSAYLPLPVLYWIGADRHNLLIARKLENPRIAYSFVSLNDEFRLNFRQIAWFIREAVRLAKLKENSSE